MGFFGIIGDIPEPPELATFGGLETGGIGRILNIVIGVLITAAGLYALFNFILAGYGFLSAGGDSKKIEMAWSKIWQSILGLTLAAGSLVLAAIISQLVFGDPSYILSPTIPVAP